MTRRLILTRHAKSGWNDNALSDHDRPLNGRGRAAAPVMGAWIRDQGYTPRAALLSTAKRVVETWSLMGFSEDISVTWETGLYLASPATMLAELKAQTAASVIMVAHNPGMASLAQWLTTEPPQRSEFERFPTCATLVLEFDRDDWALEPLSGRVLDFAVPRDLA